MGLVRRNGFTLMELIVVLVVIGLIATLAVPQVMRFFDGARSRTAELQLDTVTQAVEYFEMDNGRYPTSEEGLSALLEAPADMPAWTGPYLRDAEQLKDPWGRPLDYAELEEGSGFEVASLGADGKEGGTGDDRDLSRRR